MVDITRNVWGAEEMNRLIEQYKECRNLWDPKHREHKNRSKRRLSFEKIARVFNVSASEVERKIRTIGSQYRRERRNHRLHKLSGSTEEYVPRWFAYNLLNFLHDLHKPYVKTDEPDESFTLDNHSSTEYEDTEMPISYFEVKSEEDVLNNFENNSIPMSSEINKIAIEPTIKEKIKETAEQDEFDVFGQWIALKLRGLKTHYARCTAQNLISNVLYEADVGKHDEPPMNSHS